MAASGKNNFPLLKKKAFTPPQIINDTYGGDVREIVVLIMEVDKVVDEVTDMEIDK